MPDQTDLTARLFSTFNSLMCTISPQEDDKFKVFPKLISSKDPLSTNLSCGQCSKELPLENCGVPINSQTEETFDKSIV